MASPRLSLLSFVFLVSLLRFGRSDGLTILVSSLSNGLYFHDTTSQLLQGINSYRASLNLSALAVNQNAACLADQLAQQFKGQPCSNSTGSDTILGTEPQFPNYPSFLDHCQLNTTVTQDAALMPACVPGLASDLVLSNFTKSQYNQKLNDSSFVGAGIADEGDWVVVVLSTNTPTGSFATVATGAGSVLPVALHDHMLLLLLGLLVVVLMN